MTLRKKGAAEVQAVVKLYAHVPTDGRLESIRALVAAHLASLPKAAFDYTVNYSGPRKYDTARLADSMKRFDDIEQLAVMSREGGDGAAVTALPSPPPQQRYEFCLFARTTQPSSRFIDTATRALTNIKPIYGYGRTLRTDATPLSEAVPKRRLFGMSYEVDPQVHVWKRDLATEGCVKGLYPFNVWPTRVLQDPLFAAIVRQLPREAIVTLGGGLAGVVLSDTELANIRASSAEFRDFVRA